MRAEAAREVPLQRVAMFSVHSCPLATLGGRETGGMNVYVRELSRHLGAKGIAVDVYTRRQDPCHPTVVPFGPLARVVHLSAGPAAPYAKHQVWDHLPEFLEGVWTFIGNRDLRYDILHSHYWLSGWVALQLRQTLHIPMVHMSHTLGYPKNSAAQQTWEREPLRRLQIEHAVLRNSDALIAESPASKRHMVQDYQANAAKIHVIPCGVDTTLFYPQSRQRMREGLGLPIGQPLLLFVGRLQPLKGLDTLLRAMSVAQQHQPALGLLVIGGGVDEGDRREAQELRRLQALADDLGLGQRIRFMNAQPQEILAQYYAAADMLIMPSHYESFGMVALEAMACGIPVVASNVGGLVSTIVHGHTGFLAPAGDWQSFGQAIVRLLASPALREAYGRAGLERVHTFAWPRIAEYNIQLYRRLLYQKKVISQQLAAGGQPLFSSS